jgi:hypothetical protein
LVSPTKVHHLVDYPALASGRLFGERGSAFLLQAPSAGPGVLDCHPTEGVRLQGAHSLSSGPSRLFPWHLTPRAQRRTP